MASEDARRSVRKLPACPRTAHFGDRDVSFEGRDQGHGEGLDMEAAKASGLDSGRILERAYAR
ncbi:hypothetical protein BO221_22095 [Archangium sp. Cb G35]|nr:hypothetical protein BO221_22095 [Archangium sp. Cb G35]